jgi:hypothetical protein
MLSVLFFIKAAIILSATVVLSFLVIRKIKSKKKADEQLRHNISLLREEKLLMHVDKNLEKKRQKLLKKSKVLTEEDSAKLISKSKKLGVQTGEMLLASKIRMSCE